MTFLDPWTNAYEGIPADTENINLGANRIRDFKVNTRQRGGVDHSWGDTADNGRHNQVSFNVQAVDPATLTGISYLYTKAMLGINELFWKDSSGNVTQITTGGVIDFSTFPSGTRLSFLQSAVPAGWTQVITFNDQVIRLVNDTSGGGTGGSWTIGGVTITTGTGSLGASSGSSGSVSGTVAGHTLTASEIPSHTHNLTIQGSNTVTLVGSGGTGVGEALTNSFTTDGGTGGGGSHTHGWSGSISVTTTTTISGAPSATFSNDTTWRPAYVNACVGSKN